MDGAHAMTGGGVAGMSNAMASGQVIAGAAGIDGASSQFAGNSMAALLANMAAPQQYATQMGQRQLGSPHGDGWGCQSQFGQLAQYGMQATAQVQQPGIGHDSLGAARDFSAPRSGMKQGTVKCWFEEKG